MYAAFTPDIAAARQQDLRAEAAAARQAKEAHAAQRVERKHRTPRRPRLRLVLALRARTA